MVWWVPAHVCKALEWMASNIPYHLALGSPVTLSIGGSRDASALWPLQGCVWEASPAAAWALPAMGINLGAQVQSCQPRPVCHSDMVPHAHSG